MGGSPLIKLFRFCLGIMIVGFSVIISSGTFSIDERALSLTKSSNQSNTKVYNLVEQNPISSKIINVPLLNQMDQPRLRRGCEVTSLAMILNFKGIQVSKNDLANEIAKVPYTYSNREYGNPNFGFVGEMENGPGLGVYHGPIFDLAKKYVDTKVEDLTNKPFDLLLKKVAEGNPIWVITTSTFTTVDETKFQTWQTPQGPVNITRKMHSVVITGYDIENIYINNPFGTKDQKVDRENFIKAWEQMGQQAIVIY